MSSDPSLPLPAEGRHPYEVFVITPPRRRWWLHLLLFLLTVFTTLVMGARLEYNFVHALPPFRFDEDLFPVFWALRNPQNLLLGIPFSVTLLGILFAHEMGHFLWCLRYRVYATLPYFIPAPTLIGTFGAFIRIKSPIPTRRALFDIGVAGPIAGFVLALPAAYVGLMASQPAPELVAQSDVAFGYPLVFHLLYAFVPAHVFAPLTDLYLHPIAVAAWIGMFATALNLVPGGQLDGGHIVYAVAPRAHRVVSRFVMLVLVPLGALFWPGWLLWAFFLALMGPRHPQVSPYPGLDGPRRLLAWVALVILLLTFMPAPFLGEAPIDLWTAYLE